MILSNYNAEYGRATGGVVKHRHQKVALTIFMADVLRLPSANKGIPGPQSVFQVRFDWPAGRF